MFGSQAQKPGGLFGGAAPASSTGGLFGNSGNANSGNAPQFGGSSTNGLIGQNPLAGNSTPSTPFGNNKPAATGSNLFGNNNSTTPNNNMFGGTASTAPKAGGLFGNASNLFGSAPANNLQTTGGLFQGSSNSNTGTATSGGLFGNNNNNTTTSAPSGGLFSSVNNNVPKPATGGLFGGNTTSTSGGLFGQLQANSSTANGGLLGQNKGGLFGGTSTAPTAGSLFGSNTQNNSTNTGGLFGGNQQTLSGGLFGGNANASSTTGSNSLFAAQNAPQAQATQFTAMTRFGDLGPEIKNELTQFDAYINQQHLIATTLNGDMKKHDALIKSIPNDVKFLQSKLSSIKQALRFDSDHLKSLKAVNDELTTDITNIMHLIVQLSTPGTKLSSSFQLHEFFVKKVKKYKEIVDNYETVVNESAAAINGLERAYAESSSDIYSIVDVVKNQYQLFMELCEVVAQIHNELTRMGHGN